MLSFYDRIKLSLNKRPTLILIVGLLFISLILSAIPAYRSIKQIRSEKLVKVSKELFESEDYALAFEKARTATLLAPNDITATRHLAELASEFAHPHAYKFWEQVIQSKDVLKSDWEKATEASIYNQNLPMAFHYLSMWKQSMDAPTEEYHIFRIQALAFSGDFATAKSEAKKTFETFPESEKATELYFTLVNEYGSPEEKEDISKTIIAWSQNDDAVGIKALRSIIDSNQFTDNERQYATEKLIHHPLRTDSDLFLALKDDTFKSDFLDRQIEKRIDSGDTEFLNRYTTYLCDRNAFADVIKVLPTESARTDKRLWQNFLIAKIGIGETNEVFDLMETEKENLSTRAEESMIRALAFKKIGNEANYRQNLEKSIDNATSSDIDFIQKQIIKQNDKPYLLKSYFKIIEHPKRGPQARDNAILVAIDLNDEASIQKILEFVDLDQVSDSSPQKPIWIYLNFIYEKNLESTHRHAQRFATSNLTQPITQSLLAYSFFLNNNTNKAREIVNHLPVQIDLRSQILRAIILDGTPELERVKQNFLQYDLNRILPQESKLLTDVL